MTVSIWAANTAWMLGNLGKARRFAKALRNPGVVQREILSRYLRENAGTIFGQRFDFSQMKGVEDFRERVPISSYEDYTEYVGRIAKGEANVLTRERVRYFAVTSGSAGAEKWVPYTSGLMREFGEGIGAWAVNLFRSYEGLREGPAYWSITPVGSREESDSKVPVGFEEDSVYVGGLFRRLVEKTFAVPGEVGKIGDMEAFRYQTLLHLLRARELRVVSVWHPSFFGLLLKAAEGMWERLLSEVRKTDGRRADELKRIGVENVREWWPRLKLVSCWADGQAKSAAAELGKMFPRAVLQGKGILSTEGFVSLPLVVGEETKYPLAICSHFFELMTDAGEAVLAEQAEVGGEYTVVMTTAGGLYRYNTADRVRVTGRLWETPCVEFLGKGDLVSDLFGEKLNAVFVGEVVGGLKMEMRFGMVAPDGAGYTLFVEGEVRAGTAAELEREFWKNPHYAYCRRLGQLGHARVFAIEGGGQAVYLEECRRRGQRLGNVKAVILHRGDWWAKAFQGRYIER